MQMTMFNTFPTDHPIYQLLSPQSKYAIPFDDVLLLLWSYIAPPTSISSPFQFLELVNSYAAGRSYFDDDPKTTLTKLRLSESDFTLKTPWDHYPVAQRLLAVWKITEAYVDSYVKSTYQTDASIAGDRFLQAWMTSSSATDGGNIAGLPEMKTQAALAMVLTSLIYRITVHGISRLDSTANPALTFVANFPHCLQRQDIPAPSQTLDTKALLAYSLDVHSASNGHSISRPSPLFVSHDGSPKTDNLILLFKSLWGRARFRGSTGTPAPGSGQEISGLSLAELQASFMLLAGDALSQTRFRERGRERSPFGKCHSNSLVCMQDCKITP